MCFVNQSLCLPHSVSHFISPLALLSMGPVPCLCQDQRQEVCCWHPPKAQTPHLPYRDTAELPAPASISTRLPVPYVKGWHLSRGQLCLMSSTLFSALNSLSLSLTKAAGIVFCCCETVGMNAADALHPLWSNPVNFSWSSTAALSCKLLTQVHETSQKMPKGRKPCFPKNHT